MASKPALQREGRAERRRFARAETTARYRRLRKEIEPPPVFAEAGGRLLDWFGRVRPRVRIWRFRQRKAIS